MVTSGWLHVISQVPVLACIWNPLLHDLQLSPLFTGQAAPVLPTPLLQLQVFASHVLLIWTFAWNPGLHEAHLARLLLVHAAPVASLPLSQVHLFASQLLPLVWNPSLHEPGVHMLVL
jgi:hypothetical protein